MSKSCNCSENQSTSFIFGLFIGAIVASVVAILIYRHQKSKVVVQLKEYFQDLIDRLIPSSSPKKSKTPKTTIITTPLAVKKIDVDIPKNLKTFSPTVSKKKTLTKTFVKPKK